MSSNNKARNFQVYSGDETGGLVVDYGSHSSKFGFAGEDCPRISRRTQHHFAKDVAMGIAELSVGEDRMDHPIIMTVPTLLSDQEKIERVGYLFECDAPAVFAIRSTVASAFAVGKSTALVVELGASAATVCPVYDGYGLLKATKVSEPCGGAAISKELEVLVKSWLPPPDASAPWSKRSQYLDRIDDIKHSCCFVQRTNLPDKRSADSEFPQKEYLLPDGKIVKLGTKRHDVCEGLFHHETGLSSLIHDSISACDPDLRRSFVQDILFVGGGSLLEGVVERVGVDLANRLPLSFKPKISAPGTTTERRFSPFVGCSVLASLGNFQQLWLSKKEWNEEGERLALDRFAN